MTLHLTIDLPDELAADIWACDVPRYSARLGDLVREAMRHNVQMARPVTTHCSNCGHRLSTGHYPGCPCCPSVELYDHERTT